MNEGSIKEDKKKVHTPSISPRPGGLTLTDFFVVFFLSFWFLSRKVKKKKIKIKMKMIPAPSRWLAPVYSEPTVEGGKCFAQTICDQNNTLKIRHFAAALV